MSEPVLGVAVVSYNAAPLLRRCLESVGADTDGCVVVVDNRSTDDSVSLVRREFPRVELQVSDENRGYGAAANTAILALDTPYVLLLNPDTELRPGTSAALARYLHEHPNVAIAGPRLVNAESVYEPSAHPFPTPLALLLQESGIRRAIGLGRRNAHRPRPVDWVLGAAFAIRRDAFDAVGGFDTRYFLYQEEVDLCYRLRREGWEIHYAPVATVLHVGGGSSGEREAELFGEFIRSTQRFANLQLSPTRAVGVRAVLAIVLLARVVRDLVRLVAARSPAGRDRARRLLARWRAGLDALVKPS